MKIEDLKVGLWFIYEDREDAFSAIKIKNIEFSESFGGKYAKIRGFQFLIRNDYFAGDDNASLFYDYSYHVQKGKVISDEEFVKLYKEKLNNRILNILER